MSIRSWLASALALALAWGSGCQSGGGAASPGGDRDGQLSSARGLLVSSARSFTWEHVDGSPDRPISLVFNGGSLYVATIVGGMFVSHDQGASWQAANDGLPGIPTFAGNLFVTPGGAVLASVRMPGTPGSTVYRYQAGLWQAVTGPQTGDGEYAHYFSRDSRGNIIMTNTVSGWRSTDDGRSFQTLFHIGSAFSLGRGTDGVLYVYHHDDGAYYSADDGASWRRMPGSIPIPPEWGNNTGIASNTAGEAVMGSGFGGIFIHPGPAAADQRFQYVANVDSNGYAGSHSVLRLRDGTLLSHFERVYQSSDGGYHWALADAGIPAGTPPVGQNICSTHSGDLAEAPDGRVYVGIQNPGFGIYRTVSSPAPGPGPDGSCRRVGRRIVCW
jgi:hypothetical protein